MKWTAQEGRYRYSTVVSWGKQRRDGFSSILVEISGEPRKEPFVGAPSTVAIVVIAVGIVPLRCDSGSRVVEVHEMCTLHIIL